MPEYYFTLSVYVDKTAFFKDETKLEYSSSSNFVVYVYDRHTKTIHCGSSVKRSDYKLHPTSIYVPQEHVAYDNFKIYSYENYRR